MQNAPERDGLDLTQPVTCDFNAHEKENAWIEPENAPHHNSNRLVVTFGQTLVGQLTLVLQFDSGTYGIQTRSATSSAISKVQINIC